MKSALSPVGRLQNIHKHSATEHSEMTTHSSRSICTVHRVRRALKEYNKCCAPSSKVSTPGFRVGSSRVVCSTVYTLAPSESRLLAIFSTLGSVASFSFVGIGTVLSSRFLDRTLARNDMEYAVKSYGADSCLLYIILGYTGVLRALLPSSRHWSRIIGMDKVMDNVAPLIQTRLVMRAGR